METEITNIKVCMQKFETTLDFLKDNQIKNNADNKVAHNEILDKIDAWAIHNEKSFAAKWAEDKINHLYLLRDEDLQKKEVRNYDWVKYAVTTAISLAISVVIIIASRK